MRPLTFDGRIGFQMSVNMMNATVLLIPFIYIFELNRTYKVRPSARALCDVQH